MIQKASESGVDHVFLDLEAACAPNQKVDARDNVVDALNNLDCIMLTKPYDAPDVQFADKLLTQLELKLGLDKKIGLELLIEETLGLQNVESIASSTPRLLHPTQIAHAQDIFTPEAGKVSKARKMTDACRESEAQGEGAVMIDGEFADAATVRLYANTLDLADLYSL
jgi:citrate lyase beta subunit